MVGCPISVPRHAGQLPVYYNQIRGQHGDRYADLTQEPLFAFGEGLSYTTVEYADLRLLADRIRPADDITARVTLTNTGDRPATETVQAYVTDTVTSVTWADRELKAFTQATIQPGASVDVEITVPAGACSIVNAAGHRVVEPGTFHLLVGRSSRDRDLLRASFTITGTEARTRLSNTADPVRWTAQMIAPDEEFAGAPILRRELALDHGPRSHHAGRPARDSARHRHGLGQRDAGER